MMKTCLALLFFSAVVASDGIEKRIHGGVGCAGARQYYVRVERLKNDFCGGSLLNAQWVLTAAHCRGRKLTVKLGRATTFRLMRRSDTQKIPVNQQFVFSGEDGKPHDIMLIKLTTNASPKLPTVKLPPIDGCARPEVQKEVHIGGWGARKAHVIDMKTAVTIKCANTEIVDCDEKDREHITYHRDETNVMCAWKPGVEVCLGDAGSALHGVVVNEPVHVCANRIVIADVCQYRQWIEDTMKKLHLAS